MHTHDPEDGVAEVLEQFGAGHLVGDGIATIGFNAVEDHLALLLRNESAFVGEIGDEEPGEDTKDDGEDTFDNEDPAPAKNAALARQVRDTEGQDGADTTEDDGDDVEGSETFLDLMALIPAGNDEDKRREKAGL